MHLDQYSSLSNERNAEILVQLLEKRISDSSSSSEPLWITNNPQWQKLMMAIGTLYSEAKQLDSQIRVVEQLLEKRANKSNLSHQHALAALLLQKGDYERAEELEWPCLPQMIQSVGNDSPQAMSSRRILAKAIWMQGRQKEADEIIQQTFSLLEASTTGKYAIYQAGETEMTKQMIEELKN
jgi:hypothetical protein